MSNGLLDNFAISAISRRSEVLQEAALGRDRFVHSAISTARSLELATFVEVAKNASEAGIDLPGSLGPG